MPAGFTGILRAGMAAWLAVMVLTESARAYATVSLAWDANQEPDLVGYTVYLGTESGNFTQIQDVGNATTAVLAGLTPATTYYCTVQAYNGVGLASQLSAEVSFTTKTAARLCQSWAMRGGLSAAAAAPGAMPFNDGMKNLLKYAFNLNPAGPDQRLLTVGTGMAGLPVFTLERNGSPPCFKVEFLRRIGDGVVYAPQISSNMGTFAPMTGTPIVTSINENWERVIIREPCNPAATSHLFGRVEVTLP